MSTDTEWTDDALLGLFHDVATAVRQSLDSLANWGLAGTRAGQYHSDLAADEVALSLLNRPGLGVLSEESGLTRADAPVIVVIDPVDGSTNASRGIPWYATSLCAVDRDGPRVALVVNQASGKRFHAIRGAGAFCDGTALAPSDATAMGQSVIALSGMPPRWLGWKQYRAFGAAALDLCAVAAGVVDGYIDCSHNAHGSWDYLGGLLVCQEAGAVVVDAHGRDLVELTHAGRRTPVAASTSALLDEAVAARKTF